MKNTIISVTLTALSLFLTIVSCSNAEDKNAVYKTVDKEICLKELKSGDFQIIDVRTPEEYFEGHIEGAKNINYYEDDFSEKINQLDKTRKTMIYCGIGGRSAEALKLMKQLNFNYVLELKNGYQSW